LIDSRKYPLLCAHQHRPPSELGGKSLDRLRRESRVGFYFKDTEEFGLYSFFAGNDDDVFRSYYRTDRTFQKEEMLVTSDEDFRRARYASGRPDTGSTEAAIRRA
jgi:hypothetical protein